MAVEDGPRLASMDEAGGFGLTATDGIVEEPRHGGRSVLAEEGRIMHDAAPLRAHGGGAGEHLGQRREPCRQGVEGRVL